MTSQRLPTTRGEVYPAVRLMHEVFGLGTRVRGLERDPRACEVCGRYAGNSNRCAACRQAASSITLTCEVCGRQFGRRAIDHQRALARGAKHTCCSYACWGQIAGRQYGWGNSAHPTYLHSTRPPIPRAVPHAAPESTIAIMRKVQLAATALWWEVHGTRDERIGWLTGRTASDIARVRRQIAEEVAA